MYGLRQMCQTLMTTPDPAHPGTMLGPSWEYIASASKFHEWHGPAAWPGISL